MILNGSLVLMKNIKNKEKILRILKVLDIKDDDKEIKKEIYSIMYPGPFFHKIKKNKELGRWAREYYNDFEDWTWKKKDIDKQFYHCEKNSCIEWKEKEIERYKEQGKDLTKIPGCDGPSKISNLSYLSNCLNEYFKDKYKEKYIYSIGLIWAYERNNFIIGEKNNIIELFNKWSKNNSYFNIYEWWIFNNTNVRNIIANLIIANMLGKEFDSDGTTGYKLKKRRGK